MRIFTFLFLLLIISVNQALAQPCAGQPGRSAQTAFSVCGTLVFNEINLPNCSGPDLPPSGCADAVTSSSSAWYKFHCYQSGTLGFLVKPGSAADDYDWELMDYTGHPPGDVYSVNLMLSLNLSAITGATGCTPAGTLNIHCAGGVSGSQYNQMPNLIAGHDYLLMVTNWSASGTGYDLQFTGGTAVLTNNQPPTIASAGIVGCNASLVKVIFSEDILCNSLTALGTEFTITSGTNTITAVSSACSTGSNAMPELTLTLQNPLPPGPYTITVNNGTDGNTLLDVCLDPMAAGTFFNFNVTAQPAPIITQVTYTGCAPTVLKVAMNKLITCTSITATGSEFSITPAGPVVTSVASSCNVGATSSDTLYLTLQNPLAAGNYQLVINNGSDGNTLVDTCGTAVVAGNNKAFTIAATTTPPVIQSVVFDPCRYADKVVLNFDKPVNCASLTATGSEFTVSPGVWPIIAMASNCGPSTYANQVTLTLQNPLPGGNYNVTINNGTDGNTLSDTCFSFMAAGYNKSFIAGQAPAPVFDSVQFDKCTPSFVKVFYNHPIQCNSISANGSDFTITGPSAVNIIGATPDVTCTQGYSSWVILQFASAININGNYVLHNGTGSDGNGLIDTCNASQNTAETIAFNVLGKPSPVFNSLVHWGCGSDTIFLSHPGGNGANSWIWNFSDGTSASGQSVTHIFANVSPAVNIQLIVSNGFCSDSSTVNIVLGNVFNADFINTGLDTVCINTPVILSNTSTGNIVNYLWDFGDLNQFTGQNPPPHAYTVFNDYVVRLIATDNHSCKDTASRILHVTATASIDFTGLKSQYCTDNIITLSRKISHNITSYTWDNGDGKIFVDKPIVQFSYANEGLYTITLTGTDRYCGPTGVIKTIPIYAVPKVNLGPDTVLCPGDRMLIGVAPTTGYSYTWNTGAITPQVYSDIFTRNYYLLVDNHSCRGSDAVNIKVLPACLIRVPNAFTPNGDGVNDRLVAVNADLARNFSLKVYNRLGQLMFTTNDPLQGWNGYYKGVLMETGTFVWILSYTDGLSGKAVKEKGTSILLR